MSELPQQAAPPQAVKIGLLPILMIALIAAIFATAAAGAAFFFLVRSGRLAPSSVANVEKPVELKKTVQLALEPMLVNLADADGQSYLRVAIALDVPEEKTATKEEAKAVASPNAGARDAILGVLSTETSSELLAPGGKEALKKKLCDALNTKQPQLQVQQVFFTEFLVQR